jgi:hypothetical protein
MPLLVCCFAFASAVPLLVVACTCKQAAPVHANEAQSIPSSHGVQKSDPLMDAATQQQASGKPPWCCVHLQLIHVLLHCQRKPSHAFCCLLPVIRSQVAKIC